jgi:hypothetical protein
MNAEAPTVQFDPETDLDNIDRIIMTSETPERTASEIICILTDWVHKDVKYYSAACRAAACVNRQLSATEEEAIAKACLRNGRPDLAEFYSQERASVDAKASKKMEETKMT